MYTRKPCCGRETARCRSNIRYVSNFTAASRGSPCDSTALVLHHVSRSGKFSNWCYIVGACTIVVRL